MAILESVPGRKRSRRHQGAEPIGINASQSQRINRVINCESRAGKSGLRVLNLNLEGHQIPGVAPLAERREQHQLSGRGDRLQSGRTQQRWRRRSAARLWIKTSRGSQYLNGVAVVQVLI